MKQIYSVVLFIILTTLYAFSQTSVPGGNVSGKWLKTASPYTIEDNITIPNGSTLIIEPGVQVIFQGRYSLNIQGKLLAKGTAADSISFTSKTPDDTWSGIRFDQTSSSNDSSEIRYCVITYAARYTVDNVNTGGGIYIKGFSKVTISNSRISNCVATQGSGIYCSNSSARITNNIISDNTSDGNGSGAGIYCEASSPYIAYNEIVNNLLRRGMGAGITCVASSPVIKNNTISNNITSDEHSSGGGILCKKSKAYIIGNTLSQNLASDGGGIYSDSSSLFIYSNFIVNNHGGTMYGRGGGLFLTYHSKAGIVNNVISNNSSTVNGGAIYYDGDSISITNNTIANNQVQEDPIAAFLNGIGAGISLLAPNATIYNTILYGNAKSQGTPSQIGLTGEQTDPNIYYNNIQDGIAKFELKDGITYTGIYKNNIDTLPSFVSPTAGSGGEYDALAANWSLKNISPSLDAGIPDTAGLFLPKKDLAGNSRVRVCRIDQGAYEFNLGNPIVVKITQKKSIICHGDAVAVLTANTTGGPVNAGGNFNYLWSTGATTKTVSGLTAGTYSVRVTLAKSGCTASASYKVSAPSAITVVSNITSASCHNADGNISITPNGGSGIYSFAWSNGQSSQNLIGIQAGTYTVTVSDKNKCAVSASATVHTTSVIATPAICMVTVDPLSKYNVIVWEKTSYKHIDSFIIYREISSNVYKPIGAVSANALSIFTDTVRTKYFPSTGNPNMGSYRYKLQMKDSCSNYSKLSPYHNTIFIADNNGTFMWSPLYSIEGQTNPVNNYVLMRDDNSNGNWHTVASVSGSQQMVRDPDYASYVGVASWRLETQWSISCSPTKTPVYSASISNIFKPTTTDVNIIADKVNVSIYPNPFSQSATVQINGVNMGNTYVLKIFTIYGEEVRADIVQAQNGFTINRGNLVSGVYYYKLLNNNAVKTTGKLVVE